MLSDLTVDCLTIRCSWGPLLSTSAIPSLSIPWPQRTQDIIRWPKKSCKAEAPISRQTMISLTFFWGLRPPHRQTVLRTFPLVLRSRTNQQKDSSPGHICQCQILQDWVVPSFVLPRFCPPPPTKQPLFSVLQLAQPNEAFISFVGLFSCAFCGKTPQAPVWIFLKSILWSLCNGGWWCHVRANCRL